MYDFGWITWCSVALLKVILPYVIMRVLASGLSMYYPSRVGTIPSSSLSIASISALVYEKLVLAASPFDEMDFLS